MNANVSQNPTAPSTPKPSKGISISFLVTVLALAAGGYFAGPTLMAWYFYLTNQSGSVAIPTTNVTPERPSAPSEGNNPGFGGPGFGGPGFGGREPLSQDPVERAKRRPPAEFEQATSPSGDRAAPQP